MILLDVMLPGIDGFEVCRIIRRDYKIPIIMLTAKENEIDKVVGLEIGADDYITKPFSMRELLARVKAVLRRSVSEEQPNTEQTNDEKICVGDIVINISKREVTVRGVKIDLSPKEYELLKILISNSGRVLTRELLLDAVWGYDFYGDSRTVDVHIRWLREKIELDSKEPQYIMTVRGAGYRFKGVR